MTRTGASRETRRDGSWRAALARAKIKRLNSLLTQINPSDFTRQDTDNVRVVILLLQSLVDRQRLRRDESGSVLKGLTSDQGK